MVFLRVVHLDSIFGGLSIWIIFFKASPFGQYILEVVQLGSVF